MILKYAQLTILTMWSCDGHHSEMFHLFLRNFIFYFLFYVKLLQILQFPWASFYADDYRLSFSIFSCNQKQNVLSKTAEFIQNLKGRLFKFLHLSKLCKGQKLARNIGRFNPVFLKTETPVKLTSNKPNVSLFHNFLPPLWSSVEYCIAPFCFHHPFSKIN